MSTIGLSPEDRPDGHTYAAVLVHDDPDTRAVVLATLRAIRFTGWLAPAQEGWTAVVTSGQRSIASGRRGVVGVGEALAAAVPGAVVALRVLHDHQLAVVAWESGTEVTRYVSDPSREPGAAEDVLDDPFGGDGAEALAAACGLPKAGDSLRDLLTQPLPRDGTESERLHQLLTLLQLPTWLVSSWRLPRRMSAGPAVSELTHLGVGRAGPLGWLGRTALSRIRRWRPPPPVLADPPQGYGDLDDPMLWL